VAALKREPEHPAPFFSRQAVRIVLAGKKAYVVKSLAKGWHVRFMTCLKAGAA